MAHVWQQFTECCINCGVNAYDKNAQFSCSEVKKIEKKEQSAKDKANKKAEEEWKRNDTGW